jgi:hypothetical protein
MDAYDQKTTSYRFKVVAYNTKSASAATPGGLSARKPECLTEAEWSQATGGCPDPQNMVPAVICGFDGLKKRVEDQDVVVGKMLAKLEEMRNQIQNSTEELKTLFREKIAKIENQGQEISDKLIEVLKTKETAALRDRPLCREEHELLHRLQHLKEEMLRPNRFRSALNALDLKAKFRSQFPKESRSTVSGGDVDKDVKDELECVLKQTNDAIQAMVRITKTLNVAAECYEKTAKSFTNGYFAPLDRSETDDLHN